LTPVNSAGIWPAMIAKAALAALYYARSF